MCWRINVTSHSVVNGHTAVHHLNQSSQPSQATTTTRSSTPIPDTAARKCLPRRKREREHIKSASIILWWAADSLSQISQSLHCTVYCHRVLTLSTFNWNGERGDYPIYSGAQRFLMCLNTGSNWGQYMGVSQGIIGVYRDHSERIIKKKYNGKNCGSYFHEYSQSRNVCTKSKERDENEKKKKAGCGASAWGGTEPCIQSAALCEVLFTQLHPKSSNAGCYITQLDPPHISLLICTHLSQGTSQTHTPSQAGTQIG